MVGDDLTSIGLGYGLLTYLNQCWLTITEYQLQLPKGNFIGDTPATNY